MRPLDKGAVPRAGDGAIRFGHYSDAHPHLVERLGDYCSYCERRLPASLAVEHVQPKSHVPELETSWDNFLLACTNCNSVKGSKPV